MNKDNKGDQQDPRAHGMHHVPPGMDLMEYLSLREKAESYIETAMYLYSNLAFKEDNPKLKEKLDKESNRHADLLKSMTWMDADVAKPIVAEYPELIRRLREKDERSEA